MHDLPQDATVGQVAYQAYREHAGGESLVTGAPLPDWDDLPANIQDAWDIAGAAAWDWKEGGI